MLLCWRAYDQSSIECTGLSLIWTSALDSLVELVPFYFYFARIKIINIKINN